MRNSAHERLAEHSAAKSHPRLAVKFDERAIDAIFAAVDQCQLPGAAVGIAVDGTPVYRKGFGLANAELPVALTPQIRMRIGSISKHFTALAYLLLCEEGKAGIDDPIGAHLPEVHPAMRRVTMRQLMANISGLRDAHDITWQFSGRGLPVTSAEVLALYRDVADANASPGAAWIYCNGGYLLLSAAIERIAGQSLETFLKERIFAPIGMHDSLLRRWDSDFVPNSATLHTQIAPGRFNRSYLGSALAGEGGIVSTVDDMLRWLAHMDAPTVGSPATWSSIKTAQRLSNGTVTGYGFGLITARYRGVETLYHAGGLMGGNAQMLKVPAAGLDIIVMVNRSDVMGVSLVDRILDACLCDLDPVANLKGAQFASGTFCSPTTHRVVRLFAKDGQQFAWIDGVDTQLEADAQGMLYPVGIWRHHKRTLSLTGDPQNPTALAMTYFGNSDHLLRAAPMERPDLTAIAGRYRSEETGVEVTISADQAEANFITRGPFGSAKHRLDCLARNIWRVRSLSASPREGVVVFDDDSTTMRFSNDRTWALPLRRLT